MTEQGKMWQLDCGVSLHCLARSVTPEDLDLLGRSAVETLELSPPMLAEDRTGELHAGLHALFDMGSLRAATVHTAFGGDKDLSSPEEAVRTTGIEAARRAIEVAAEFGASMIVVHASAEPISAEERGDRLRLCRNSLSEIGRYAGEHDKRIAVELLPRTCLGNTVGELLELLNGLAPERFGVCLDTNHLMDRWETIAENVASLDDRLWTLHVSDYDGVDEKHWPPGRGVIRWLDFVNALRGIGYRGPFNYEATFTEASFSERLRALQENFEWMASLQAKSDGAGAGR